MKMDDYDRKLQHIQRLDNSREIARNRAETTLDKAGIDGQNKQIITEMTAEAARELERMRQEFLPDELEHRFNDYVKRMNIQLETHTETAKLRMAEENNRVDAEIKRKKKEVMADVKEYLLREMTDIVLSEHKLSIANNSVTHQTNEKIRLETALAKLQNEGVDFSDAIKALQDEEQKQAQQQKSAKDKFLEG